MIKRIILGLLICLSINTFAQNDDPLFKVRKSEIGIDVTSIIGRTVLFGPYGSYSTYYEPTYFVTYRQHFSTFRIRALVGGDYNANNLENNARSRMSIDYKLGIETITNLGRKWQIFYGLDLAGGHDYDYREQSWTGQLYEIVNNVDYIGAAPFLGLKFFISNRMNVSIEASILFRRNFHKESTTWMATIDENPNEEPRENTNDVYTGFNTQYIAPDFIVLGFKL